MQILGYKPDLSYNIALCHYMLKQYAPALKHIADIIERGIRMHPGEQISNIDIQIFKLFTVAEILGSWRSFRNDYFWEIY